jgi:hypothetical protein
LPPCRETLSKGNLLVFMIVAWVRTIPIAAAVSALTHWLLRLAIGE